MSVERRFTAKQKRIPTQLRDDQIGISVTRNVSNSNGSWLRQLHSVQTRIFRYISPAAGTEIPEQGQLPTARSFPDSDKIDPAVIVVINRGNSPAGSHGKSGNFTRSSRLPSTLRHKLTPGAPAWVKAKSIQPSLSKSRAITPTAGGRSSFLKSIAAEGVNFPWRGFK